MKRLKTGGLILLCLLLVFSLFPVGAFPTASAAASYFYFTGNDMLQNSTVSSPYLYNSSIIDLQGTFTDVQSDTIKLTVEQIYQKPDGTYDVVDGQFYTRDANVPSGNQFEVFGITLFTGINRLTLSGTKSGATLQDEFFILYDDSPYLLDLKIQTGSDAPAPLNAGVGTVVTSAEAFLEGSAPNATSIVVNGDFNVQPLDDGTFFTPIITLNPGKNTIKLTVKGKNDSFTIDRTVYYYNGTNLIFEGFMYFDYDGSGVIDAAELADKRPVVGDSQTFAVPFGGNVLGGFVGKIMVPYNTVAFDPATAFTTAQLDGDPLRITNVVASNLVPIRYGDLQQISYASYDLTFDVSVDTTSGNRDHMAEFITSYSGANGDDKILFTFANSNEEIVENVQWLYDYPTDPTAKMALNGAQINNSTIYVEVDKNKNFTGAEILEIFLSPFDPDSTLTYALVSSVGDKAIYKVDNIPPGSHTFVFNFQPTPDVYDYLANVVFVSGAHAVFTNVFDGMIILDTDVPTVLKTMLRNVPVGYDPTVDAKLYINGAEVIGAFAAYTTPDTEFNINIAANPLMFGENLIKLEMTVNGYLITKEIRVFVQDDNLPTISHNKPILPPVSGVRPDITSSSDRQQMYNDMTGLTLLNDIYYTTVLKYDLIFEVSNFRRVQLQYDGKDIFEYDKIDDGLPVLTNLPSQTTAGDSWVDNKIVDADYNGLTDTLYFRIRDVEFPTPGSQIFNLKITNDTGSQAIKRLEVVREVVPYTILSPVPTVGNDIIVNKNFVNFKIQAEDADKVIIGKQEAAKITNGTCEDCFEMEYLDLKEGKWNEIKFTVVRGPNSIAGSIKVFYANTNVQGAQYKEPLQKKHQVFNKALTLEFDKGTLLRTANVINGLHDLYEDQRILFGIANPDTGVVEEFTDEGVKKTPKDIVVQRFIRYPDNFTFISPIYWVSGGLAEKGTPGTAGYEPKLHGMPPHNTDLLLTYTRTDPMRALVPTQRGELTMTYDSNVRESAGVVVTIFHFDENGNWVNMGGIIDEKRHDITVPFDKFGYYAVAKMRYSFSDIQNHPWARDILEALYAKGFMDKVRFDEFGSDDYITRGEFAQLLVRALQLPLNYDNRNSFFDVQPGSRYGNLWEYKYIETAARAGIVHGLENRIFGPNMRLTREQASVMIARALEFKLPTNDEKLLAKLKKEFTDYGSINYYARPAVMTVLKEEIMVGKPNVTSSTTNKPTFRFDPLSNLTRAEAGAVAVRIMQQELRYFPKNLR